MRNSSLIQAGFLYSLFLLILIAPNAMGGEIISWKHVVPESTHIAQGHAVYGQRISGYTHFGVDIMANCGKDIYPLFAGEVVSKTENVDGRGNAVMMRHPSKGRGGSDLYTIYLHMQEKPTVSGWIECDQSIGKIGKTGFADGCHTHFEIRNFYHKEAAGNGWYHKNAKHCETKKLNIYACGDVSNTDWVKRDWEDPEKYNVPQPCKDQTPSPPGSDKDPLFSALIIDSSGSMNSNDPKDNRLEAARFYVDRAWVNEAIALVDFDSSARTLAVTPVAGSRSSLKSEINRINSSGSTNIGEALLHGLDALNSLSGDYKRIAIFLTDGKNTVGTYNDEHLRYRTASIPIFTIALSDSADKILLRRIAADTNGTYHEIAAQSDVSTVITEIYERLGHSNRLENGIINEKIPIRQGQTVERSFNVADNLSPNAKNLKSGGVLWVDRLVANGDVVMTLTQPDGTVIDRTTNRADVRHALGDTYEIYEVKNPMPGGWKVSLYGRDIPNGAGATVTLNVSTTAPQGSGDDGSGCFINCLLPTEKSEMEP